MPKSAFRLGHALRTALVSFGSFARGLSVVVATLYVSSLAAPGTVLAATYSLSGSVMDAQGNAQAGAVVDVLAADTSDIVATATTDGSGNYSISVAEGTYDVRVTPPVGSDFSPALREDVVIAGNTILDFVLVPANAVTLSGHIRTVLDEPLPNVSVQVWLTSGGPSTRVDTDADGFYSLQVAPGSYWFHTGGGTSASLDLPQNVEVALDTQASQGLLLTHDTVLDITVPVKRVDVHVQDPLGNSVAGVAFDGSASPAWGAFTISGYPMLAATQYTTNATNVRYTDASGNATLWLVPGTYGIALTPPAGSPYVTTTVTGVVVTGDRSIIVVLDSLDGTAPAITIVAPVPYGLYRIGMTLDFSATDSESGVADVHGTLVNTLGLSQEVVSGLAPEPGVYTLTVTATDNLGNVATSDAIPFVIYDPSGGFATGGGWFYPDAESNLPSSGKASFGFVAKYKDASAKGDLEFQYKSGPDINLKSTSIDWLVLNAVSAQFQGAGTINGTGWYTFRVMAKDNAEPGAGADTFSIKVWEGADTSGDPIYKAKNVLTGGNIRVRKE